MRLHLLTFATILLASISFAQETVTEDVSLNGQFDKIYRTSTSYQVYKVISKEGFQKLKSNVLDSINSSKKLVLEQKNLFKKEKINSAELENKLAKTKLELDVALKQENSISLFGLQLSKITYNLILWAIIALLLSGLMYFIFKFSRSHIITKKAENSLLDVEQEFDKHRKKSLEREQKLRRQLQDEINKHRNS
ncbi:MAG: hypothetical protein V3V28_03100 [Polaribacter sp.]|uniref:hypothetical protein n=1 Tax=Polaribacter sp. TaxID=1920175 RepID=UPI002F36084A